MKITVLYFAKLKSVKGLSSETVETQASTIGDLYDELGLSESGGMPKTQVKAALNEAFCDYGKPIREGDTIAFMPPMSGG